MFYLPVELADPEMGQPFSWCCCNRDPVKRLRMTRSHIMHQVHRDCDRHYRHKPCHNYHTCHIEMMKMIDMTHMTAIEPKAGHPSSR
jgi:hypothetical protein